MAKSNQAVATANAFSPAADTLPAFLQEQTGRGNENVGDNLEIPRIKLLQKMNDEVDKNHDKYIEGAEVGDFLNVLTGQLYKEVYVISVNFNVEFVIWRKREHGGGKQGTFSTRQEANEWLAEQGTAEADKFDVSENHQHLLLIYDQETGQLASTPAIMDFSGSKLRVSKNWNSKIIEKNWAGARTKHGSPKTATGRTQAARPRSGSNGRARSHAFIRGARRRGRNSAFS